MINKEYSNTRRGEGGVLIMDGEGRERSVSREWELNAKRDYESGKGE